MGYLQCVRVSACAAVRRSREAVNERNDVRKRREAEGTIAFRMAQKCTGSGL